MTKKPLPELAREQWDFSKCLDDRLFWCVGYEYAREVEWIRSAYARDQRDKMNFDDNGNWFSSVPLYQAGSWPDVLRKVAEVPLHIPPGFPDAPYLKTAHEPPGILEGQWPRFIPPLDSAMPSDNPNYYTVGMMDVSKEQVVPMFIDWSVPDLVLKQTFEAWLVEHRPKDTNGQTRRGNASHASQMRAMLKQLSAWRLLRHFSAKEAASHTGDLGFGDYGGLYRQQPEWSEAKRKAATFLAALASRRCLPGETDINFFLG